MWRPAGEREPTARAHGWGACLDGRHQLPGTNSYRHSEWGRRQQRGRPRKPQRRGLPPRTPFTWLYRRGSWCIRTGRRCQCSLEPNGRGVDKEGVGRRAAWNRPHGCDLPAVGRLRKPRRGARMTAPAAAVAAETVAASEMVTVAVAVVMEAATAVAGGGGGTDANDDSDAGAGAGPTRRRNAQSGHLPRRHADAHGPGGSSSGEGAGAPER